MIIGYCRVSTKGQLDGNGLESQEKEILEKHNNAKIIKEACTGVKVDRPKFNEVIKSLQAKDMLVVTKLDRLARSTVEGIKVIEYLFSKNISVHVLNIGLLENTTIGKFFLTTLLAVAEMERSMIIERTQAGKEIAKQDSNFREGRPCTYSKDQKNHALHLLQDGRTYKQVERLTGISKSTLIRFKNRIKNNGTI